MAALLAPLTVAVAQPECTAGDIAGNALAHAAAVSGAESRVVVFPELSLTGYDLDAAPVIDPDRPALVPLVQACAQYRSVAFVGAPVADEQGRQYIATLAVTGSGVNVVYQKMFLGADETLRFHPGLSPTAYTVDGWRLGLAICKDTGTAAHTSATAELGLDAYLAGLVMHPHEIAEQDARARRIARENGIPVAFASFAGPTGRGYSVTAGHSGIWAVDGTRLAHAGSEPGDLVHTELVPPEHRRG